MATTVAVTRVAPLTTSDLSLSSGAYKWDGPAFDAGQIRWRRHTEEGDFTPGRTLIHRVKDFRTIEARVIVIGATQTAFDSALDTLVDALSQFTFQLKITTDTYLRRWQCEAADMSYDAARILRGLLLTDVKLIIPAAPEPLEGSL